jgi:hypothetical protein
MTKVSRSPDRHTWQKNKYLERCAEDGKTPSEDYLQMWDKVQEEDRVWGEDPNKHENDLEYDLRTNQHLCAKVRASETYAQNLYAAMCNVRWQKREILPILKDQHWSCTWRSAGGIVADMLGKGDYIDWYCSGIYQAGDDGECVDTIYELKKFVPEGTVTEEISNDLYDIGWVHSEWPEDR